MSGYYKLRTMKGNGMNLRLERRDQPDETGIIGPALFTPPITEDYWAYRVIVGEHQAIVGFPKFSTVGIGFAVEEDWNSNLPYRCDTDRIWNHIKHNKGSEDIPDEWCVEAIRLIQAAAHADKGTDPIKDVLPGDREQLVKHLQERRNN